MVLTAFARTVPVRTEKASRQPPGGDQSPLGFAAGDVNLYRFVGNDPIDHLDPSGLIDITIDLQDISNTDAEERSNMPKDTIWAGRNASLDKVLQLIKEKANGQKISRLTLTGHCGNEGVVLLAPNDQLSAGEITKWKELLAAGKVNDARFKATDKQVTFLKELAAMADKGGMTIDFVQCASGGGDKGKQLIAEVSSVCGGNVTIKMYDKSVMWVGGQPKVTTWLSDLLGDGKPTEVKKPPMPSSGGSSRPIIYPGGACFTAGTLVATQSGRKAIELIVVGDLVHSWNEREEKFELRPVVELYTNSKMELYHVRGPDWEVTCSAEHPFLLEGGKWRMVHEMQDGDIVQTLSGRTSDVLEVRKHVYDERVKVYNFQVQTTHTYCVTNTGVVVHNKPP